MPRRVRRFFLCFLLLACARRQAAQVPSKSLVVASGIPIGDVTPLATRSGIGANILELLYSPLFKVEGSEKIIPSLAAKIRWENDEKTLLHVELNEPLAGDVKDTVDRAKKMVGGDLAEGLKNLDSVSVISDHEVVFQLKKFDRAFLILLAQIPIVASSRKNPETGDFYLFSKTEDSVIIRRKVASSDKVNEIKFLSIPSTKRAVRELVAGNVDIIFFPRPSEYQVLDNLPEIKVDTMNTRLLYQLLENRDKSVRPTPIDWSLVRHTMDPKLFSSEIGQGPSAFPEVPVPDGDPWLVDASKKTDPSPAKAREASGGETQKRNLCFLGEQARDRQVARILKRYLDSLGYSVALVDLNPVDFAKSIFQSKDFDLVLLPFNIKDTLVSDYLVFHSPEGPLSLNFSRYSNAEVDRYLDEARYSRDDAQAKGAFASAMNELRSDPPGLFLFWLKTPVLYRQGCTGFILQSTDFFPSLKDVRCEPSAAN